MEKISAVALPINQDQHPADGTPYSYRFLPSSDDLASVANVTELSLRVPEDSTEQQKVPGSVLNPCVPLPLENLSSSIESICTVLPKTPKPSVKSLTSSACVTGTSGGSVLPLNPRGLKNKYSQRVTMNLLRGPPCPPPFLTMMPPFLNPHPSTSFIPPPPTSLPFIFPPFPPPPIHQPIQGVISSNNHIQAPLPDWSLAEAKSTKLKGVSAKTPTPVDLTLSWQQPPVTESCQEAPETKLTKFVRLPPAEIMMELDRLFAQNFFNIAQTGPPAFGSRKETSESEDRNRRRNRKRSRAESRSPPGTRPSQGRAENSRSSHRHKRKTDSGQRNRRSRSTRSSSTSACSTSSSLCSSFAESSRSSPKSRNKINYTFRRENDSTLERNRTEFCRMCEIKIKGSFLAHRRGKNHIRKEVSAQGGCVPCGIRCFDTYREYKTHHDTRDHEQKQAKWQSEQDSRTRRKLGLPEEKVLIVRHLNGSENVKDLSQLNRPKNLALKKLRSDTKDSPKESEQKRIKVEPTDHQMVSATSAEQHPGDRIILGGHPEKHRSDKFLEKSTEDSQWKELHAVSKTTTEKESQDQDEETNLVDPKTPKCAKKIGNGTLVTSTTTDTSIVTKDFLGLECIIPVNGYFCKACLKFFNTSSDLDLKTHCSSAKHQQNYMDAHAHNACSGSSSAATQVSSGAGKCAIVYDQKKVVKEIFLWKTNE